MISSNKAGTDHLNRWTALLPGAGAAPMAIGSGKNNTNRSQPMEFNSAKPRQIANLDSDVTLVASSGESDGDSENRLRHMRLRLH